MRIALAELAQETDSFSPLRTGLPEFETYGLYYGNEIPDRMPGAGPVGGFLDVAAERSGSVEIVPLLRAWASAGGPILDATFETLRTELATRLRAALPVDAVFLALHGAAAAEAEDDIEGAVLEDVRNIVGRDVPIAVPLDHHANITGRMAKYADLLVGHETQPHDPPATGRKAARLLLRMLAGEISPVVAWQKIPMITPQDQFLTSAGPMKTWFDRAREHERRPGVLDVSPYPMQPWLDVAEGGWAVVAHTDRNPDLAREIAADMARLAWEMRRDFWRSERVAPAEAVRQTVAAKEGLVILSDSGDSTYGGAPGDNTVLLQQFLDQRVQCLSLVPVIDEKAVAAAFEAGVSSRVTLPVGGRNDSMFSRPVEISGRVAALSEGVTTDIPGRGVCRLGRTALLECGAVRVALLDHRSFGINHPILYSHLGVEVADAKAVVLKTASNFQFFERWRKQLLRVDTPGTTQSNLSAFNWRRLPRPIDPFDEIAEWTPDPQLAG
jgi:microcystin degradation protein MlrC